MSASTTIESRTSNPAWHSIGRGAAWGGGAALAVNLTIWLIGSAGEPVRVVTGWAPDGADLTVGEVVITTVVAVGLGTILLRGMQRHRDRFRLWATVVALVAVASSIPLWRLDVDTGSKIALTFMHLATAAAAVTGQAAARPGARTSSC